MTTPYKFNEWVRITGGMWTGETGFVKSSDKEKGMTQIELNSDGECMWFFNCWIEKFVPSN